MRTSVFNRSFYQPINTTRALLQSSDIAGPSTSASASCEPTPREEKNYSSEVHGEINHFFEHEDFVPFLDQYTSVLNNITAFVRHQGDKLKLPLLEKTKQEVEGHFDKLKKHLFEGNGKFFLRDGDHRPLMYGTVKKMFHEFSRMLEDEGIPLQNRINAVLALAPRAAVCSGGLGSDLQETIGALKLSNGGVKAAAYQWKIKMMDELIRQYVKNTHHYTRLEEIHYANAYYNLMANEMGVEKRVDPYAQTLLDNRVITPGALNGCKKKVFAMLKPVNLANELAGQYHNRIEAAFHENGIDPNNVSYEESQRLATIQEAELNSEYGEVSHHILLPQKDPDDYGSPYVYSGKDWLTGLSLHFLKEFKKQGWVDNNDSKIVLGNAGEGRIKMRDNLLWFKEKGVPPQRVTVQTWSGIHPQELFEKIKEAEPGNARLRFALMGSIVEMVGSLPQKEEAKNVLGMWLMHATDKAKIGMFKAMLKAGVDKEFKDSEGQTALMHAAAHGQVGILKILLKAGVSLEARDNLGRTALMHAAANGQVGTLKALLKAGAKKSTKDNEGKTAKMHAEEQAARQGDRNAPALRVLKEAGKSGVSKFLSRKQKHDATKEERITAMLSSERVDLGELKALIEKGANIHAKNDQGYRAVTLAARHGHADALQVLIENGADIEETYKDLTPVMLAATHGHTEALRVLIENGAEIETTHKGLTPVMLATKHGHANALRVLIENGADIEAMHKPDSVLHLNSNKTVTNALLLAIENADVDCMRVLLESGANTEVKNEKGMTPLMSVVASDDPRVRSRTRDMLRVLIENGAHINSQRNTARLSPLMYAVLHTNVDAVRVLLENGANINLRHHSGLTAQDMVGMERGGTDIWNLLQHRREWEEAQRRDRRNN